MAAVATVQFMQLVLQFSREGLGMSGVAWTFGVKHCEGGMVVLAISNSLKCRLSKLGWSPSGVVQY